MSEHRRVCPDEMIRCSICGQSLRRSALIDHQKDPDLIPIHFMAMQQTIDDLQCKNQRLERRVASATSKDRDRLLHALKGLTSIQRVHSKDPLALAIEGMVGVEAWENMCTKKMMTHNALVGLLDFLSSKHEDGDGGYSSVISSTLEAISNLIKAPSGFLAEDPAETLVSVGACNAITKVLRAFPTDLDVHLRGWSTMGQLVAQSEQGAAQAFDAGACEGIVSAVQTFPSNEPIQEAICQLIALFVHDCATTGDFYEKVGEGGCKALLAILRAFPANVQVQRYVCMAVADLAQDDHYQCRLAELGACQAVIAALHAFPHDQRVQSQGCLALLNLACNHPGNQAMIGDLGGCEAVVAAIKAFPDDKGVQLDGSWAIENLLYQCDDNRRRVAEAAGGQALVGALARFPKSRRLQAHGCKAIALLAQLAGNRGTLVHAGACEAVVAFRRAFSCDEAVQQNGCSALYWLAVDNEAIKNKLIEGWCISCRGPGSASTPRRKASPGG